MKEIGIFIFHRDLRVVDNLGLIGLQKKCNLIIPVFIFDKNQLIKSSHYFSNPACKFLCEAVKNLHEQTGNKLCVFYGDPVQITKKLITLFPENDIIVGFNADFTKYALERDNEILKMLASKNVEVVVNEDDFTLVPMNLLLNGDTYYKKYDAFKRNIFKHRNKITVNKKKINFMSFPKYKNIQESFDLRDVSKFYKLPRSYSPNEIGNRKNALDIIKNLKYFKGYNDLKDNLSYNTTHISAYLNFGLISEREFFKGVLTNFRGSLLVNQVIWRDYYLCILRYEVLAKSYEKHIDPRYDKIRWKKSKNMQREWDLMMKSKTGFLLVDACIAEITKTGFLHNRGRLILGYFTVKYLHINPLEEWFGLNSWFSRYLIDCITSQNKLNCQFITELDYSGKQYSKKVIDGRPFNIDNGQIKKYDPDCKYIKKWLPHLKDIDNFTLYKWSDLGDSKIHPLPIFNPVERYKEWIQLCGKVKKS
jgi:deoxyribodipyrimidine photo-lyase